MSGVSEPLLNEPARISYLTDDPSAAYNARVTSAESWTDLIHILEGWRTLAPDALAAARAMTDEDWPHWVAGLRKERRGRFAGEAWAQRFMVIVMPERMLRASMVADQFKVPWGLAWLRLKQEGQLDARPTAPASSEGAG